MTKIYTIQKRVTRHQGAKTNKYVTLCGVGETGKLFYSEAELIAFLGHGVIDSLGNFHKGRNQ